MTVRLFAPFDPVVWDRLRFETFWGWAYRFEAYTPAPKRVRGYYALPLMWRDDGHRLGQPVGGGRQLVPSFGFTCAAARRKDPALPAARSMPSSRAWRRS
ncbi:MAG: crosslink repair DNA glycosylase YcaQ family protein [Paludibaculum sp.]